MNKFRKGWEIKSLGDIATISSGGTPSKNNMEYWKNGTIPWIRTTEVQNCVLSEEDVQEFITESGLKNSSAKLVPAGTILLAMIGQGKTRGQVAYLSFEASTNQNCATIVFREGYDSKFYFQYLLSKYESIRGMSNSAGQSNLSGTLVKSIKVPTPPLPEQIKIAEILSTWDNAIQTTEKQLANSQQQKKALMQMLLSGEKRVGGFSGEWKTTKLSELLTEEKQRNKKNLIKRVLSVTNHSGFVLPEEQFSKRVASDDISNYKTIKKGQFGYNPSRLNVGSFARLDKYDEGVLSPMYVIFSIKFPELLDSDYFCFWMQTNETKQRILNSTQGSVRESVGFDALCSFPITLPTIDEQQKIAEILTTADQEIDTLQKKLECLKLEKRALMQRLL